MGGRDPQADVVVELRPRTSLTLLAWEIEQDDVGSVSAASQPRVGEHLSPETVSPLGTSIKFEKEGASSLGSHETPESIGTHLGGELGSTALLAPPLIQMEAGQCPAASDQRNEEVIDLNQVLEPRAIYQL